MAKMVVDVFEVVNVRDTHSTRFAAGTHTCQNFVELADNAGAVEYAGQWIDSGSFVLVLKVLGELLILLVKLGPCLPDGLVGSTQPLVQSQGVLKIEGLSRCHTGGECKGEYPGRDLGTGSGAFQDDERHQQRQQRQWH